MFVFFPKIVTQQHCAIGYSVNYESGLRFTKEHKTYDQIIYAY